MLFYFQIFRKEKEERDLSYYLSVQLKIISKKKKCNQRYIHKTNSTEWKIDQTERNDMKTYTYTLDLSLLYNNTTNRIPFLVLSACILLTRI